MYTNTTDERNESTVIAVCDHCSAATPTTQANGKGVVPPGWLQLYTRVAGEERNLALCCPACVLKMLRID